MLTRKSGILALVLGATVLGACEQKAPIVNIPPVTPATTVTIAGAPTAAIKKGTTVQLVAVVANNTNQAVTWSVLSGTNVVSVSSTGLVTALNPGTAVVQAVSAADATAKAAVSITVADTATGGTPVTGTPTVSISAINQNGTLTPVNPGNVAGRIDVIANVDIPTGVQASAVVITVNGVEVCRQTLSGSGSADVGVAGAQTPVQITCTVNTASLTAAGAPNFPNGNYSIKAQVLGPTGTVIASATSQPLTFNNTSSLLVGVSAAKTAPDASGLTWNGGDVTVTVTPSIFAAGTTFQTFTVSVQGHDTTGAALTISKTVATTGVAAATIVFKADSSSSAGLGLKGIEDPSTVVAVTGVTTAGNAFNNNGAAFFSTAFRYDDAAPRLTGVVPTYNLIQQPTSGQYFLKASATFPGTCAGSGVANTFNCGSSSTAATANGVVDAGVDLVTWQFQTSTAPLASSPVWTTQTSVAGIGSQPAGALIARLNVCDNLGNCKTTASANNSNAFGVDLLAPILNAVTSVSGVQANPVSITVAAQDTGVNASGFPLRYVSVQITKDSASSTSTGGVDVTKCVSWRANTGTTSPDTTFSVPSSGCPFKAIPVDNATTIVIDNTTAGASGGTTPGNGYYTVTVRATDVAGNTTTSSSQLFLLDNVAPTVSSVAITYTTGATTATVTGTIHDNVDLKQWNTRESYAAPIVAAMTAPNNSLPFSAPTVVKSFGIPVQGNASPNVTLAFVGGVSTAWGAAPIVITGLGFSARDQASNFGEAYQAFTAAPTAVTTTDVVSSSVSASPATICQTGTNPPCADVSKTSTTLSAQLVMNATATANPLVTVYFYYVDAAGRAQYVSQTNAFSLVIPSQGQPNANQRVFTYTSSAISAATLPAGTPTVFAIGVDKNNVGVLLGQTTVTVQ